MQQYAKVTLCAGVAITLFLGCNSMSNKKPSGSNYELKKDEPVAEAVNVPTLTSKPSGAAVDPLARTSANATSVGSISYDYTTSNGLTSGSTSVSQENSHQPAPPAIVSSSAAVETGKDTSRKFIRTADLKFKVKSVVYTTYSLEDITRRFNGFVSHTNLISAVDSRTVVAISADSSLETTYYTVSNEMQLRVPNTNLDTVLKTIAPLIDYLDFRTIKANDISLQLLSNQMAQERIHKHEQRLTNAIDLHAKKLAETTDAEDNLLNRQEQADNTKISSLSIMDQVKFSTITLNIYQRQAVRREIIPNDNNVTAYEPGFFTQVFDAARFGYHMLESLIITFIRLWALWLFGLAAYCLFKLYRHKFTKP